MVDCNPASCVPPQQGTPPTLSTFSARTLPALTAAARGVGAAARALEAAVADLLAEAARVDGSEVLQKDDVLLPFAPPGEPVTPFEPPGADGGPPSKAMNSSAVLQSFHKPVGDASIGAPKYGGERKDASADGTVSFEPDQEVASPLEEETSGRGTYVKIKCKIK